MKPSKARKILNLSNPTLHLYVKKGLIKAKKNEHNGFWDYDEESVYKFANKQDKRINVVYGRVSTANQSKNLDAQIESVIEYANKNGYQIDKVYKDIASGMTYDRKSFKDMITKVFKHEIKAIFISYKDRFSRISFDMWKEICKEADCELIVVNKTESEEKEIFEDIISLLHCFSMKMYSNRRKKKLELIRDDLKNEMTE